MQKTTNYQLNQWEPADGIERAAFNADNAAIDAALAAHDTAITDTNTQLAAVAAALGTGGKNCRIAWGSYTGTGTYGEANPTRLEFDFYPLWFFVADDQISLDGRTIYIRPMTQTMTATGGTLLVTWEEQAVSWYVTSTINPHIGQNNSAGHTYYWVAFGYAP